MKEWKQVLASAIVEEFNSDSCTVAPGIGKTDRAVKFCEVAKAHGYTHIDRQDIVDIAHAVEKAAPQLHPVKLVADPNQISATESLWRTLFFTDLDL